jgi:hypothetical protein
MIVDADRFARLYYHPPQIARGADHFRKIYQTSSPFLENTDAVNHGFKEFPVPGACGPLAPDTPKIRTPLPILRFTGICLRNVN